MFQSEYSSIRGKYKSIRSKYEETQLKLQDLQTSYKEELSRSEILEKECLQLEKELNLVRKATHNTSPYDQDRQAVMVVSLQNKLDEYQEEIDKLQPFIVEQDAVSVVCLKRYYRGDSVMNVCACLHTGCMYIQASSYVAFVQVYVYSSSIVHVVCGIRVSCISYK